jgi:hypothetical protein
LFSVPCEPGYYLDDTSIKCVLFSVPCEPGYYLDDTSIKCVLFSVPCEPGYYLDDTSMKCVEVADGMYQPDFASTSPGIPCPQGQSSTSPRISLEQCVGRSVVHARGIDCCASGDG